jgi:hypothetical protein
MLKIALNYCGYLRTWSQCKPNHYENVITPECDLYFYTYTHENPYHGDKYNKYYFTRIPQPFHSDPFEPHKFDSRKAPENTVNQTQNQWISNFVGFCLIPNTYDVYVRIRPDIKFNGGLNFKEYDYSGNNIYIPQGSDFGGVNDQFAFGNYKVMKAYYSVLLNYGDLWHEGTLFHSESMQLANLNSQGINIVRIGSPQIDIIR